MVKVTKRAMVMATTQAIVARATRVAVNEEGQWEKTTIN
jgi:hypothetical protein